MNPAPSLYSSRTFCYKVSLCSRKVRDSLNLGSNFQNIIKMQKKKIKNSLNKTRVLNKGEGAG